MWCRLHWFATEKSGLVIVVLVEAEFEPAELLQLQIKGPCEITLEFAWNNVNTWQTREDIKHCAKVTDPSESAWLTQNLYPQQNFVAFALGLSGFLGFYINCFPRATGRLVVSATHSFELWCVNAARVLYFWMRFLQTGSIYFSPTGLIFTKTIYSSRPHGRRHSQIKSRYSEKKGSRCCSNKTKKTETNVEGKHSPQNFHLRAICRQSGADAWHAQ